MGVFCITNANDTGQISESIECLRAMTIQVIRSIVRRCERDPSYPFIDTKWNLIDGTDFSDDDPVRGKGTIYAWIQGRGLEAFAAHAEWLGSMGHPYDEDCKALKNLMARVLVRMEEIRSDNDGRLFFMMRNDGRPIKLNNDGNIKPYRSVNFRGSTYSDLFYCKGMLAAAELLGREDKKQQACAWFDRICADIFAGSFQSDQQALDPKNVGAIPIPGRIPHGPFMIALGGVWAFGKIMKDKKYAALGMRLLDHVLERYVNIDGKNPIFKPFDMWEFVDQAGKPFVMEGKVFSDPGHGTEFVGLAMKMLCQFLAGGLLAEDDPKLREYYRVLPSILLRSFENGFSSQGYGIVKSFDLVSRTVIHSDMPWWSLPETMRAACLCGCLAGYGASMREVFAQCFNAFNKYYVKPQRDMMAIQTLQADGSTGTAIPAAPDADPAYHTGMSLIDCITYKANLTGQGQLSAAKR